MIPKEDALDCQGSKEVFVKVFVLGLASVPLLFACSTSKQATPMTTPDAAAPPGDDASFSFVVVGCNRIEESDVTTANPSTANIEQLSRTFTEVAALDPPPKFFFFAGDMVLGYGDATTLEKELRAWVAVYEASPLASTGIALVPILGNHEAQKIVGGKRFAYAGAEATWLKVMGPYIRGSNGPAAGGADGLTTDQSQLTYSFDSAGTHFVVLNTDPVGKDWQVPTAWVATDLASARAAGAKHIFAIGHKPAYASPVVPDDGLIQVPAERDALWNALEDNHAEAMLSAHNHLWYKTQPRTTWQIIAGNGGSQLEAGVTGKDAYYGFTVVEVSASGRITAKSYGRDVPKAGYLASSSATPTTVRETVDLTWK